jgi:hypothetical protein
MYIGQSKKKCFKFSRAAPHQQDGSDTIPTRNKSKFKNEAEYTYNNLIAGKEHIQRQ